MKPLAKDTQLCKPQSQEQKQSQDSGASAAQHSRGCLGPETGPETYLLGGTREQASSSQRMTSLSPSTRPWAQSWQTSAVCLSVSTATWLSVACLGPRGRGGSLPKLTQPGWLSLGVLV